MRTTLLLAALLGVALPAAAQSVDPPAVSLSARIVRRHTAYSGVVRITGTVRNVGSDAFRSGPGQQTILLSVYDRVLVRRDFTDLAAGESIQVSVEVEWTTSLEFPPEYVLRIAYDPDLYADGRASNDDQNREDDSKRLSGYDVHDLFRREIFLRIHPSMLQPRPLARIAPLRIER